MVLCSLGLFQILHGCANNRSEVDAEDTRTQHHADRIGLSDMPDESAPYFDPARDGGNTSNSGQIVPNDYPARDGGNTSNPGP